MANSTQLTEYDRGYAFGYNAARDKSRKYSRSLALLALKHLKAAGSSDDFDRGYIKGYRAYLGK